jgi:hypothetical protein
MSEPKNPVKAPLVARLALWFTVAGVALVPFGIVIAVSQGYYGVKIGELVPALSFLPDAVFKVFSVIGLFSFLGAVSLGVLGLVRSIRSRSRSGIIKSAVAILAFMVLLNVLMKFPGYLRFRSREKQIEAKQGLVTLYQAEQIYFERNGKYAKSFRDLDMTFTDNLRYAFFLSETEVIQPHNISKPYSIPAKYRAFVDDSQFQILAVGNVNLNPDLDVWAINERKQLRNLFDDVQGIDPNNYYP